MKRMSNRKGHTRLDDMLQVPDEASEKDRQRIMQVRRNCEIRRDYPDLREKHGWEEARKLLAERYSVSRHTVQMVLEQRR
jgi:hypothetical protein